jgi:hypothetical protein
VVVCLLVAVSELVETGGAAERANECYDIDCEPHDIIKKMNVIENEITRSTYTSPFARPSRFFASSATATTRPLLGTTMDGG